MCKRGRCDPGSKKNRGEEPVLEIIATCVGLICGVLINEGAHWIQDRARLVNYRDFTKDASKGK